MKRQSLHIAAVVLTLLGTAAYYTFYQVTTLGLPLKPDETIRIWTIDVNIRFQGQGDHPAKVILNLPKFQHGYTAISERFISDNYGLMKSESAQNRQAIWSKRRPKGDQSLYYRVIVHRVGDADDSPAQGPTYTKREAFSSKIEQLAADSLMTPIRARSADIETFVSETIKRLNQLDDNNAQLLLHGDNSIANKAIIATHLLSLAHIPAEIFYVLPLINGGEVEPLVWMRSYNGKNWLYFDPGTGNNAFPVNALPWWWGENKVYRVKGGKNGHITFSINSFAVDRLELAKTIGNMNDSLASRFSLYSLPVQVQNVYSVLLTIPVGVIVILFLRSFVGVKTFGTFTPILIALAFRETQLTMGIMLFVLVTALGLLIRTYLEHLRLLMVPRLGIVLTCVVMIMLAISMLSHQLGLHRGLSVALFPMVILTMVIERMSILWEERGALDALVAGVGSLFAASMAYLAMTDGNVVYLVFTFPFLLLGLMAVMILVGRYSGYRLSELKRFKTFLRQDQ